MMDKDTAAEMIQAKALGCLDKNEKKELNEYLNLGGEFPWREFGEFQSLVSLLPIILELEVPDVKIKDKVAKRIYEAIAESKAKRSLQRESDLPEEDLIYPETTVLGEQIQSDKNDAPDISDNALDKLTIQEAAEPGSELLPDAYGGLSDEPPLSGEGFEIKSTSDSDIEIPEPEVFYEKLPADAETMNDLMEYNIESTSEVNLDKINEETSQEIGSEAGSSKPSTSQEPIKSKYRTILEEKSKRKPVEEIPLKKEKFVEPEKPVKKGISGLAVDIIVYILLLAAIAFVYLSLSSEINNLRQEMNQLKKNSGSVIQEENQDAQ